MKTSKLIEIASRFGYRTERSASETGINFIKNKYDDTNGVELTGRHYVIIDSMPPQLAHAIIDYANTPVEKREDEKRWNVVIGQDLVGAIAMSAWHKGPEGSAWGSYIDMYTMPSSLKNDCFTFTDAEFSVLIEKLKSMPDGETYAKIAELGKREVKP